jgi:Hydrazine synthase alpha subunit middle domain
VVGRLLRLAAFLVCSGAAVAQNRASFTFLYTEAPRYQPNTPGNRFPAGASLQLDENGRRRPVAPGFAASADPAVSFDGRRVLFSGKQKAGDPWQIWEIALAGGAARRVTAYPQDAMTPFYLAGGRIVYALRTPRGFQLETVPLEGGERVRLTYAPGDFLATDVLRDGRVLMDSPQPDPGSLLRELFTVYVDGSGIESYRCDHGRDRHSGRQLASGDIVFETGGRLARFTSARAVQLEIPTPAGEFAGPVAEISPGDWLVAYRADSSGRYGIYHWKTGQGQPEKVLAASAAHAVQPVLVRASEVPKWHPSGLGDRDGANLLCLNAYTSRSGNIPASSVAAVRVWAVDHEGLAVKLGQAPVERDGSFFVETPADRGIRFELLDQAGKTVAAEKGWFWARRGEQRVCVGCHAGPERAPENAVPETLLRSTQPVRMALPVHTGARGNAQETRR